MPTDLRLFGIRHHGPSSAASLGAALEAFRPDIVLLECPADGEAALATLRDPALVPPVALLLHNPRQPGQATFLPFAEFSLARVAGRALVPARGGARAVFRPADGHSLR